VKDGVGSELPRLSCDGATVKLQAAAVRQSIAKAGEEKGGQSDA